MTITAGTTAQTTLIGAVWRSNMAQSDVRAINTAILDDVNARHPQAQVGGFGGFVREGQLYVPNRGVLVIRTGDYVLYDPATGFPILLSSRAAAGANWVHT